MLTAISMSAIATNGMVPGKGAAGSWEWRGVTERAPLWTVVHVPLRVTFTLHQGRQRAGPSADTPSPACRMDPHIWRGGHPRGAARPFPSRGPVGSDPAVGQQNSGGSRPPPAPDAPPGMPPPSRAQWGFSKAREGCPLRLVPQSLPVCLGSLRNWGSPRGIYVNASRDFLVAFTLFTTCSLAGGGGGVAP